MRTIPLERWALLDFDPGEGVEQDAAIAGGVGWMSVTAPGDTYLALIDAGRLVHPFQGQNEAAAAWVRDREWWQRIRFDAPEAWAADETVELVFEGLDTFASLYLDGELIGRADNMFRRYAFDISDRTTPGAQHTLAVCFDPPARAVTDVTLPVWSAFKDRVSRSKRNLIRKAQFGWGWDWGPDLPTVGIWKAVRIEIRPRTRLGSVHFSTRRVIDGCAEVEIGIECANLMPSTRVRATLHNPCGECVFEHEALASEAGKRVARIDNAEIWWTADLGAQPLYALHVALIEDARTLDETRQYVGLRTIELDQSPDPDEPGTHFFRFVLNGVPIFAKGACWVPSTSFVGALDETAYRRLIMQTVGANMNMIRVWGGGIYEPDLFYELCDRHGVLVWQDFMFACAQYPEQSSFVESVRAEVEDQVRRLRNHACLALWCGNNESQAMHRFNADLSGDATALSGLALYDELMPHVLAQLDPVTPYRPGSPWGGPNPNSMRAGDVHNWTVWHGIPLVPDDEAVGGYASGPEGVAYTRYAEDKARFVSEFGIQAAPAIATLERWMDTRDLRHDSSGFHQRIKDEARKADALMSPVTGLPASLQEFADFSQWTQAEGLKYGIEHFRRRRPHCSGALLWQLNDCWPCVSWSLIDYDGAEKAAYHAVRRAFAPVLASFRDLPDASVELWLTNDALARVEGEAVLSLETLDGQVLRRETLPVSVQPASHAVLWRGAAPQGDAQVLRVWSANGTFEPNRLLSAPISKLAIREDATPAMTITRLGPTRLQLDISAQAYCPFVHLVSNRADVRFSDNHFDLAAGEARRVIANGAAAMGPGDVALRSWLQSAAAG